MKTSKKNKPNNSHLKILDKKFLKKISGADCYMYMPRGSNNRLNG